jgi:DNA-binding GntR family transcriptional regulator
LASRKGGPLSGQAYAYLRREILEGRLLPGTPLSRRGLAAQLGTSPVPVGDAISRLEAEGLVETRPQAGSRIRIATPEEIHGNYVLREALETHSARLFSETAGPADRRRLLAAAQSLDAANASLARSRAPTVQRRARVERLHHAFHLLIAKATRVPQLVAAIERSQVLVFNSIFTVSARFQHFPTRWHRDLAEAILLGSPHRAAEAMRTHVRYRQAEVVEEFRALAELAATTRMVRGPQRNRPSEDTPSSRKQPK